MKNSRLSKELAELIDHRGGLCASLIIPTQGTPESAQTDVAAIKNALSRLKEELQNMSHGESQLLEKATALAEQAMANLVQGGIGIFVSQTISRLCTLPFAVKERVILDDSFELRDLVQKQRYMQEYLVLLVSGRGSRLFRTREKSAEEVSDQNFPSSFNGMEYEAPLVAQQGNAAGTTLLRDMAVTTRNEEAFYNLLDEKLNGYFGFETKIVVAGASKELGSYMSQTQHSKRIIGTVQGSFDNSGLELMKEKVWECMKLYMEHEERELLHKLEEMGRAFVSTGIRDVWGDARQGKGNILLVERDLEQPGYTGEDRAVLQLNLTNAAQKPVADAVDDAVEAVLAKNGTVVFVDNGLLQRYNGIAMMNRY